MTISTQVAMWGIGIIFVLGGFQSVVLYRLTQIEKKLGNGSMGVFPRRDEVRVMISEAMDECDK